MALPRQYARFGASMSGEIFCYLHPPVGSRYRSISPYSGLADKSPFLFVLFLRPSLSHSVCVRRRDKTRSVHTYSCPFPSFLTFPSFYVLPPRGRIFTGDTLGQPVLVHIYRVVLWWQSFPVIVILCGYVSSCTAKYYLFSPRAHTLCYAFGPLFIMGALIIDSGTFWLHFDSQYPQRSRVGR